MREKLIELLSDAELPIKSDGRIIGWYALDFDSALYMADHLIANGVTVPVKAEGYSFMGRDEIDFDYEAED